MNVVVIDPQDLRVILREVVREVVDERLLKATPPPPAPAPTSERRLLTLKQAALRTGTGLSTLKRMMREGEVQAYRAGKNWRVDEQELFDAMKRPPPKSVADEAEVARRLLAR